MPLPRQFCRLLRLWDYLMGHTSAFRAAPPIHLGLEALEGRTMLTAVPLTGPNGGTWVLVDTLTVATKTNQNVATGVTSNVVLAAGQPYQAVARGEGRIATDTTGLADAEFIRYNQAAGPQDGSSSGYPWANHGVRLAGVDGGTTTGNLWGTYQSDHQYVKTFTGQGTKVTGYYVDAPGYYGDNSGTLTVDLYALTGAIGDRVFVDANGDGVQQPAEPGAAGVTVTLTGGSLAAPRTAVTDAAGHYTFTAVPAGGYTVTFAVPRGYALSTPAGGSRRVDLAAGQTDDSADAGLVPVPVLDGRAVVAARGYAFDGPVATVEGSAWAAGSLAATIEWGDGTSSAGTLVAADGTLQVVGRHTYSYDGAYALAVRVSPAVAPAFADFAGGLAYVLAPTDHRGPQAVSSVTVTGGGSLGDNGGPGGPGFTASVAAGVGYTLTESGEEPGGSFTLTRSGTLAFSLWESGGDFAQPDSSLTLTVTEAAARVRADAAPLAWGTSSDSVDATYTLTQTGTGADYTWNRTGTERGTVRQTLTVADGTLTAAQTRTASLTGSGTADFPAGTASQQWSGTDTRTRTEAGYHGPVAYGETRTEAGTVTGSESGGTADYGFVRNEGRAGTYSLSRSESYTGGGGTEAGTGRYADGLTATGNDAAGDATATATQTADLTWTGAASLGGVPTTSAGTRSAAATDTVSGNAYAGPFVAGSRSGAGGVTTLTRVSQGVTFTQTVTANSANSSTLAGSLGAGGYTLTGGDAATATTTARDVNGGVTHTATRTQTASAGYTRTGDRLTGAYSLHETDSSSFTAAGGSSHTTVLAAGSTSGRHTLARRETASGSLAATVDQTGTLVTGAYSLHRTGTDTATEGRTQTDDSDAAGAGGATRAAHATTRADATATAYPTADRAGNALTGAYSLHETATSTATRFATSTADSSAREAGTTRTAYSGEWSTVTGSDATTADRTGSAVSGDYTITQATSAGSGAVAATATGTASASASDGSYASSSRLGTSAAVFLSGATGTGTGNAVTGASTATRTAVAASQATATVTARSTARSADQSDASAAEGSTSTTTRTDGSTVTESAAPAAGAYSLHQQTTADATVRATGTASAYATGADGATGDESRSATSQATSGGTGTFDRTWNADSGSYSLYQSSTDSGAATATAGYRATDTAADGAYASASRTSTSTAAQYDSASEHRNGSDVLGDYTLSDAGTAASATVTSTDTTAGTWTAVSGAARSEAGTGTFTHRQYDTTARDQTGGELGGAYTLHRYASSSSTNVGASTATDSWVAADGSRGSDTATAGSTAREYATATVTQDGVSVTGEDSVHQASGASATTTAGGTASNSWVGADGAFASRTATSGATAYRYGNDTRDATTALDSGYSLHQVTGGSATAIATDTASGFWQGATAESRQDTSTAGSTRYQYSTDTNDFTRNFTGGYAGTAVSAASATAISADTASSSWADLTGASRSDTATANSTAKTYLDGTLRTRGDASGTYSLLQTDSSSATVTGTSTASDVWAGADGATGADTLTRGATAYQYGTGTTRGNGYPTLGTVHTESGGSATFIESATGSASQSGADSSSRSDTLTAGSTVRQYADATTDATSASTGSYTLTATAHSSATATGTNTASAGWFGANGAFGADTVTHGTTAYRYATTTADENRTAAKSYARTDTSVGSATLVSADTAWDAAYGPDGSTSTHAATADATDKSYARTTVSERGDATGTYSVRQTDSASATLTANSTATDKVVAADGARWQATATAGSAASRSVTATVTNNGLPGSDTLHRESTASATTVDTGTATSFGIDAAGTGRSDARSATTTAREYGTAAADSTALAAGSYTLHTSETSSATVTGTSGSSYYWLDANLDSGRGTATAAPTLYQYFTGTGDYNRGATGSYTQSDASAASATALSADTAANTLTTYDGATRSDAVTADSDARNYLTRTTNKRGEQRTGSYSLLETSNESSSVTAAGASSDTWVAADGGTGYGTATGGSTVHQYADATATQTGVPTSDTLHRVGSGSSYATGTNTASSTWEDRDGGFGSTTQTGLSIARQFAQGTADATAWSTGEYTLRETSEGSASAIGESTSSGTWHGADDSTGEGTATQNSLASQFYNGTGDYSRTADGAFGRTDTYSGSSTLDADGTASNTTAASDGATRADTATAETHATGYSGGTITAQGNDTGTYSLRQTDTSGSTVTTANTASDAWTAADSAHGADTQTARSTAYQYGNTTLRENGDATSSTVHQDSPSSATVYASETGSASKVGSDGSTKNWTRTADSTARQNATDSVDVTGTSTGNYTLHATSVSSASVTGTTTTSDFWEGADGSVGSDTATGSSTRYQYGTGTRDYSTNASDSYAQTDRYVGSATLITGDSSTEGWLEGSGRQGRRTQTAAATAQEYADNTLAQRADASGSYSLHQTDSPSTTATAAAGWTVTVQTPVSGGSAYTETAAGGQTSSVRQAGSTTVDNHGNSSLGDYTFTVTEAGGGTRTLVNRDPGLTTTAVVTETRDRTTAERGNTSTGTYSLFASSTTDRTAPVSGEDARGSFTGHDTAHAAATTREDGNRNTGRSTSTQVTSDTWDADRTGGASGDTYTQTRATTDDTTYTYFVNDGTGDESWTGAEHHTARVDEHGAKPSYTTYSLRDESTHDLAASMALDADTGVYTLTRGETTTSKLTQTGGGSSSGNTYDLSKTATAYDDTTRVGDAASGEYALTGAAGETSTAVGTSTQESRGTTFTEVLSDDHALTEYGNDYTGDYFLTEDGETTADFRSDGTARPYIDDPVSTVHVTETSEGTYDRTTTGNRQAGGYRIDETSGTDYDFTQTVTGETTPFVLSGSGKDTATATETGADTTGAYTRHATGTDHYTLDQSGTVTAAFTDHVTGTDAYVEDVTGNHLTQAYDRTTTGGGAWSRTATGGTLASGTGTNAYTHTENRDDLGGDYLSIVSGESRYQLLETFHDLVSSSGSRGPGNVTFHSHGLPYRDPGEAPGTPPSTQSVFEATIEAYPEYESKIRDLGQSDSERARRLSHELYVDFLAAAINRQVRKLPLNDDAAMAEYTSAMRSVLERYFPDSKVPPPSGSPEADPVGKPRPYQWDHASTPKDEPNWWDKDVAVTKEENGDRERERERLAAERARQKALWARENQLYSRAKGLGDYLQTPGLRPDNVDRASQALDQALRELNEARKALGAGALSRSDLIAPVSPWVPPAPAAEPPSRLSRLATDFGRGLGVIGNAIEDRLSGRSSGPSTPLTMRQVGEYAKDVYDGAVELPFIVRDLTYTAYLGVKWGIGYTEDPGWEPKYWSSLAKETDKLVQSGDKKALDEHAWRTLRNANPVAGAWNLGEAIGEGDGKALRQAAGGYLFFRAADGGVVRVSRGAVRATGEAFRAVGRGEVLFEGTGGIFSFAGQMVIEIVGRDTAGLGGGGVGAAGLTAVAGLAVVAPGGTKPVHIDIGGEGRYPGAVNVNPSPVTSTTGAPGRPIPNRVPGTGEKLPQANQSADIITVENTPISPGTASEIARVIKPGGEIRLVGPQDYAQVAHQRVIKALPPGATVTQTTVGTGETAITTTVIKLP